MRAQIVALLGMGLAGIVAAGCSSSNSGDGGTTTTTGGTTTGGTSGLAVGAACSGNTQCLSGVCGVNGTGNCCSMACSTTDPTCGALACDNSGACTYPGTATTCGTNTCTAAMLVQKACNGSGICTAGAATACPNNFGCDSTGTACNTSCAVAGDCANGFTCTGGACVSSMATGPCTSNSMCASGFCGVSGTGNCCTAQCMPATDMACNPTGCDATSGACVFPAGNACGGAASCTGAMVTASTCDATGACNSATSACMNNLGCNDAGTGCNTTCIMGTDCATGFWCSAGTCTAQMETGPCTENDACTSGFCGVTGTGNCCVAQCTNVTPPCGAVDCDNGTGACTFAANTVSCGPAGSCTGNTQTNPTVCDGMGNCPAPGTKDCTPFICGANACLTSCTDNTSCVSGDFCDTAASSCCSGLSNGGTLTVDGMTGNDTAACCGIGSNAACETLTRAMKLIDNAQASGVTINAAVSGTGGDWAPAGETYPIVLGWGVELSAPGVFFLDPNGGQAEIFDVAQFSANDMTGYASIVGTAASPVGIGMNQANNMQSSDTSSIQIEGSPAQTLFIANAVVNGSATSSTTAISVTAGGTLTLGSDKSGGITGTVNIGNALNAMATDGWIGISCAVGTAASFCSVNDVALTGINSVIIQGQEAADIQANDFSVVSLTSAPIIGIAPSAAGFGNCGGAKPDVSAKNGQAVALTGPATVTFSNGMVQCLSGTGFALQASGINTGMPLLTLDSDTIQNTDLGVYASAGTATITNTTFNYNFNGVHQDTDGTNNGTIDLSGGGNTIVCSSNQESSTLSTNEGIDVYNSSTATLNASNVAWDTTGPDYFSCSGVTSTDTCTCNITTCSQTAPFDDMDAVQNSNDTGDSITTTGNTQGSVTCN